MTDGITLTGLEDVNSALEGFEKKIRKKVLKKAMGKSAADIRKVVKTHTPKGATKNLFKSVTSKVWIIARKNLVKGAVFYSQVGNKKGSHANWIEYGTNERFVKNYRGHEGVSVSVGSITGQGNALRVFKTSSGKQISTFKKFLIAAIEAEKAKN